MTEETPGSDFSRLSAPRAARWWAALIVAASAAVFSGTLASPFLLDDVWLIRKNPVVQESGRAFEAFTTDYWGMRREKKNRDRLYRPLTVLSLAANRALGGNAPGGYRAVNIFLHAAAGLLLFWMAGRFGLSIAQAGAAALLFALHPLHTEAVNAVVGRADLLAAIAAFAGMGLMLGGALPGATRKRGSPGKKTGAPKAADSGDKKAGGSQAAAGVGAIFLLGLLSKEIGASLLLWAALWWGWSRLAYPREESGSPGAGRAFAAMGIALALYLALRYQALGMWVKPTPATMLDNPLAYAEAGGRMFGALGVLGRYLKLLVWPWPLAIDYSYGQVLAGGGETALFAVAGGAGLTLWGWAAWRRRGDFPGIGFGLTLFLAGWFPVSNFAAPIGTVMAERLMYLPSAGFLIAFAPPLARALGRRGEGAFIGALAAVSLLFGGMIWARNRDWADPLIFWRRAAEVSSKSARAHRNYGQFLLKAGRAGEAAAVLTRAVDIYPFYAPIWVDLGNAHGAGGRMAEAERSFRRAIEINPGSEFANFGLGQVLVKGRRLAEARPFMEKAVSLSPRLADARFMLGNIYMAAGETVQAVGQFKAALSILPREPRIHHNLALAYLGQGDHVKAGRHAREAARLGMRIDGKLARELGLTR